MKKYATSRFVVNYPIRPPLALLGFILSPVWVLFGVSDEQLALRDQKKLEQEVRELLPFLFDEQHGRIVPEGRYPGSRMGNKQEG
jgi:hypothetical protein